MFERVGEFVTCSYALASRRRVQTCWRVGNGFECIFELVTCSNELASW